MREIVHVQVGQCGNQVGPLVDTVWKFNSYRVWTIQWSPLVRSSDVRYFWM